jgi:hypothetical protein
VVFPGNLPLTTTSWGCDDKKINTVTYLNNDDQLINTVVFLVNTRFEAAVCRSGERDSVAARGVTNPDVAVAACME